MQAFGLKTYIWNNNIRALLLLTGFILMLVPLCLAGVWLFRAFYHGPAVVQIAALFNRASLLHDLTLAMLLAMAAALIWFGIALLSFRPIIDSMMDAKAVTAQDCPRLFNAMELLCISRGLKTPRLTIIETPQCNAFASGLARGEGSIAITSGLLDALNDDELSAVLAHELTHLQNGDGRLMVIMTVFAGALVLAAYYLRQISFSDNDRQSKDTTFDTMTLLAMIATWPVSVLVPFLQSALSRNREYLADAGAVELTKNPDAMISALRAIEGRSTMDNASDLFRAVLLDAPATGWFPTHPSIEDRIVALQDFAGGRDPGFRPAVLHIAQPSSFTAAPAFIQQSVPDAELDAPVPPPAQPSVWLNPGSYRS